MSFTKIKTILLVYFIGISPLFVKAQGMEDAKWWMGAKAGINFTYPHVSTSYSVMESLNQSTTDDLEKEYETIFKNIGPSLGITLTYSITPSISISAQPGYLSYYYNFSNNHIWSDSIQNKYLLNNSLRTKLHYIELPLLFKYEYSFQKLQPYIQLGAYYSFLLNGKNILKSDEKLRTPVEEFDLHSRTEDFNVNNQYISSLYGLIGGVGLSIDVNFFRIGLDCNYRYGLNNITDRKNRLEQQTMINSSYEVADDIKLQNLEFTIHCSTPLDYLIHTPGMSGKAGKVRRR
ncbi:MAG: PorT family protein [Cytophagales bacterium]|nr:MAG: PorT family protein [Cytophagales bacterium]